MKRFIFVLFAMGTLGFADDRFPGEGDRASHYLETLNNKIDTLNEQIFTLNETNLQMRRFLQVLAEAVTDYRSDIDWELNPHAEFTNL